MRQSKSNVGKVLAISIVVAVVLGVAAFFGIGAAETSALNTERSDRVALVAGQLQAIPGDEGYRGMANKLAEADSSERQYWILERDGVVLFSKNAAETNAFHGLPASGHPVASQVQDLVDSTREGEVGHESIAVGGDAYLVSVTRFTHGDDTYALCLVTASEASAGADSLLDPARAPLYALVAAALVLVVAVPTLVALHAARKRARAAQAAEGERKPEPVPAEEQPEPEPAPAGEQPEPEPEPEPEPIPTRPADELEPYLSSMVAAGVESTHLARVACDGSDAALEFRRNMAANREFVLACFDVGEGSFVLSLASETPGAASELLVPHLPATARIVTIVPLFE